MHFVILKLDIGPYSVPLVFKFIKFLVHSREMAPIHHQQITSLCKFISKNSSIDLITTRSDAHTLKRLVFPNKMAGSFRVAAIELLAYPVTGLSLKSSTQSCIQNFLACFLALGQNCSSCIKKKRGVIITYNI